LLPDKRVRKARRRKAVKPANAARSEVRKILAEAASHFDELVELWEKTRGKTSE
jgi:hypothetical protein